MSLNEKKAIERIRDGYTEKTKSEFDELRELNARVRRPAAVFAYIFGILGALILGTGMCLAMKVIGDLMIPGILIGAVGIAMVSLNYYIYDALLRSRKKKHAPEILAKTELLLRNE